MLSLLFASSFGDYSSSVSIEAEHSARNGEKGPFSDYLVLCAHFIKAHTMLANRIALNR